MRDPQRSGKDQLEQYRPPGTVTSDSHRPDWAPCCSCQGSRYPRFAADMENS
jgi:hypothetical protein